METKDPLVAAKPPRIRLMNVVITGDGTARGTKIHHDLVDGSRKQLYGVQRLTIEPGPARRKLVRLELFVMADTDLPEGTVIDADPSPPAPPAEDLEWPELECLLPGGREDGQ